MRLKLLALVFLVVTSVSVLAQAGAGFTKLGNVTTTTYTDPTCPNQSTCYYQVTTVDSTGHESAPAACSTTALCRGGNEVVAQMPSSGTHSVLLTWTASTSTGVSYNVWVHLGPFSATNFNATVQ